MEIEKLIEALGDLEMCAYGYHINGEVLGMDCTDFECLMVDAAEEISKIPALQAENDRLKEEVQQMRWIPVEERLPKPQENPVIACDYTGVCLAWYSPTMGWQYRTGLSGVDITHWMPLPKAPKEENEDD